LLFIQEYITGVGALSPLLSVEVYIS
jgi:hypothetical protein